MPAGRSSVASDRRLEPDPGEKGASQTGPSPVDRGRPGSKQHLLVDGSGLPLAWTLTGGNRNDVTQLLALLDRVPPVRGRVGRPRQRPDNLIADRGYDHDKYRRLVWQRGIKPVIARRKTEHGSGLASNVPSPGSITAVDPPPHRPPTRNPRSIPRPRLLPDLLAPNRNVIQLELLIEYGRLARRCRSIGGGDNEEGRGLPRPSLFRLLECSVTDRRRQRRR